MSKLRLICTDVFTGDAAHVGGPVRITKKTFDVDCPPEVEVWLKDNDRWNTRTIDAVEFIPTEPTP